MLARGIHVPQPTLQIAQTLQRVGFAQLGTFGLIQREGIIVMLARGIHVPQPSLQIAQTLQRVGFARAIPDPFSGFQRVIQPFL